MTVPTNLLNALNGLAAAAKTAGDPAAISLLTQIYELADYGLPAYTAAATSTTAFWTAGTFYPAGSITPSFDTAGIPVPVGSPGSGF